MVDQQRQAHIQFDWAQALGFAAGEPISQEAIEAGILAAWQHLLARSVAVPEGAGLVAVAPVRAI